MELYVVLDSWYSVVDVLGKSSTQFMQFIGRSLNGYPQIALLVRLRDDSSQVELGLACDRTLAGRCGGRAIRPGQ